MKKEVGSILFFIGWVLSPFTTWNDLLVNVPLSYLIANFLYCLAPLPLKWLLIGSYIFTNILGLLLMYLSGREYILPAKNKTKAAVSLVVNTALLSAIVYFLDKSGKLMLLSEYFSKLYHHH